MLPGAKSAPGYGTRLAEYVTSAARPWTTWMF